MPHAPLLIGHRGAPGYLPEHTEAAFALAIEQGAEAVEVDVVPSRDGEVVVRHEPDLAGTTDVAARPEFADRAHRTRLGGHDWHSWDLTWGELATLRARERLPRLRPGSARHDGLHPLLRLDDVARLAAGADRLLVVEVKAAAAAAAHGLPLTDLVADRLAALPGVRVVVESFEREVLTALAERGVDADLVYLMEARGRSPGAARSYRQELADLASLDGLAGISVPTRLVSRALVDRADAAGLFVWTWTLRPENRFLPAAHRRLGTPARFGDYAAHWRRLAACGVTGVFADHPDLAAAVLR